VIHNTKSNPAYEIEELTDQATRMEILRLQIISIS